MTTPTGQTRDAAGNLTGTVHLADGTTETVDQLNAWADAFEDNDRPAPVAPHAPAGPTSPAPAATPPPVSPQPPPVSPHG